MLADQAQIHYYYNDLTVCGSQAIRIHANPCKKL